LPLSAQNVKGVYFHRNQVGYDYIFSLNSYEGYLLSVYLVSTVDKAGKPKTLCFCFGLLEKKKDGEEGTEIKSLGKLEGDIEHFAKQRAFLPKLGLNHMVSLERTDFCCFTMKQQVLF